MTVRVIHGINDGYFDLEGISVGLVADRLRQILNIPHGALAFINGNQITFNHLLSDGDCLEFIQKNGRKGGIHDFWSEAELLQLFGSDSLVLLKQNGFLLKPQLVATAEDVMAWHKWLADRSADPKKSIPIQVNMIDGTITVRGVQHGIDQQMAAVVQCLLDAKGELRSTTQMKLTYPKHILDERKRPS